MQLFLKNSSIGNPKMRNIQVNVCHLPEFMPSYVSNISHVIEAAFQRTIRLRRELRNVPPLLDTILCALF
jgi:hypothetical protein